MCYDCLCGVVLVLVCGLWLSVGCLSLCLRVSGLGWFGCLLICGSCSSFGMVLEFW